MDDLRLKAQEARESGLYNKIMVITDGVFSMDGDIAKLPEIVEIAETYDLITYVDDAHGSGVLGGGAGTVKHFGLSERVDIQIGTLSKAVGVVGGYVAGSRDLVDWLKVRVPSVPVLHGAPSRYRSRLHYRYRHPAEQQRSANEAVGEHPLSAGRP